MQFRDFQIDTSLNSHSVALLEIEKYVGPESVDVFTRLMRGEKMSVESTFVLLSAYDVWAHFKSKVINCRTVNTDAVDNVAIDDVGSTNTDRAVSSSNDSLDLSQCIAAEVSINDTPILTIGDYNAMMRSGKSYNETRPQASGITFYEAIFIF